MKTTFVALALLLAPISSGHEKQSWTSKRYHSLADGNKLYADCQSYSKDVRVKGDGVDVRTDAGTDLFEAGECWAYVMAVVDSIPGDEGFDPDPDVRQSQYVDVVSDYLRDHPERRQLSAYYLARTALTDAFPPRPGK